MKAILKREWAGYFHTGLGFLFLFVFSALSGIIFYLNNLLPRSSDMGGFFALVSYQWVLLAPILTMRLLPSDKINSTQPLLMSAPVSMSAIVSAKYLSALMMLLAALLLSFVYPLIILFYGKLYLPEILTGYLGLFLYGAAYLAVDMLVSAFTKKAASAFVLALGVNLLLRLAGLIASGIRLRALSSVLSFFDLEKRYTPFVFGQMSFASLLYYVLVALTCLVCTVQAMNMKRWSRT